MKPNYFYDTSALLKVYHKERGTEMVEQLASFLLIAEENITFVCADRKLNEIVVYEGYKIIDPLQ